MVWFGIFWLVCLTIVLVEVLRAPTLPPFADDGDPEEPQDHPDVDREGERLDQHNPHP